MSTKISQSVARRVIEEFDRNGNLAVADERVTPQCWLYVPYSPSMEVQTDPFDQEGEPFIEFH